MSEPTSDARRLASDLMAVASTRDALLSTADTVQRDLRRAVATLQDDITREWLRLTGMSAELDQITAEHRATHKAVRFWQRRDRSPS